MNRFQQLDGCRDQELNAVKWIAKASTLLSYPTRMENEKKTNLRNSIFHISFFPLKKKVSIRFVFFNVSFLCVVIVFSHLFYLFQEIASVFVSNPLCNSFSIVCVSANVFYLFFFFDKKRKREGKRVHHWETLDKLLSPFFFQFFFSTYIFKKMWNES